MKRNKVLIILLILAFISTELFAISFGFHVFDVRTTPEFANGVYPVSALYQFDFPMESLIGNEISRLAFRIDSGLVYRTLSQNPDDGRILDQYPEATFTDGSLFSDFTTRDYTVHYDEFNMLFEQGFFGKLNSHNDLVTVHASFGGRFEMAYERLNWMSNPDETAGVFWKAFKEERFPGSTWAGQPELAGSRSVFQTFLTFGATLDMMMDDVTSQNGLKLDAWARFCHPGMIRHDGSGDFNVFKTTLSAAYTPLKFMRKDKPEYSLASFTIGTELSVKTVSGKAIPYYVTDTSIYGVKLPNTVNTFTNRVYATLYGPQLNAKDLYPFITVFNDYGISFGNVVNRTEEEKIAETAASFGFKAEFVIYNFANIFYELGYVYKEPFTDDEYPITARFGISVGV